ncbi:Replication protein A 32 kDa subunit-like, partial [Homarus americanus]
CVIWVYFQIEKISVVGLIRDVEVSSVSRTYTIDDTTAVMNVIQWEDLGMCDPLMEMTYCQLVGTLRTQQGKRNLIVLSIRPLTDINYITKHILEVIHFPLMIKQVETLNDANARKNAESNSKGIMSNSLVGASGLGGVSGGSFSGLQGLTGQQNMVLQFISNSQDEAGPSRSDIYTLLKGKIGNQQVDKMLDFLSNEGHIYTTIDDDHFKSTEG